jgi:hypothetical protein
LLVPSEVISNHIKPYTKNGKPIHHNARVSKPILDIVNEYNSEIRGLYNYYCVATDVSDKIGKFRYFHYGSLLKTIARKEKTSASRVLGKYGLEMRTRDGKGRKKLLSVRYMTQDGEKVMTYFDEPLTTHKQPMSYSDELLIVRPRCQLIERINARRCEYCGKEEVEIHVHHIRKLKDVVRRYRKRGKTVPEWVMRMARMNRKTLALCADCHEWLHAGKLNSKAAAL